MSEQHPEGSPIAVPWRGVVPTQRAGQRLDCLLAQLHPELTRSQSQRLLRLGLCSVDGRRARAGDRPCAGARITLWMTEPSSRAAPERVPLVVLYEDEWLIVVNKPPGMTAHPARGAGAGTLLNALCGHVGQGGRISLVHRLDRDTSGAIMAAKSAAVDRSLRWQMCHGRLRRRYWALVWGEPPAPEGTLQGEIAPDRGHKGRMMALGVRVLPAGVTDEALLQAAPTGGAGVRTAVTRYRVLARGRWREEPVTWIEAELVTGRTHQVRVQLETLGCPLLGDRTYRGGRTALAPIEHALVGQALHSRYLEFVHPVTGQPVALEAEVPDQWRAVQAVLSDLLA